MAPFGGSYATEPREFTKEARHQVFELQRIEFLNDFLQFPSDVLFSEFGDTGYRVYVENVLEDHLVREYIEIDRPVRNEDSLPQGGLFSLELDHEVFFRSV